MNREKEAAELVRKYSVSSSDARYYVMQYEIMSKDWWSDEAFEREMIRRRAEGEVHAASMLWFVHTTKVQGMSREDATELLIALKFGARHEAHAPSELQTWAADPKYRAPASR